MASSNCSVELPKVTNSISKPFSAKMPDSWATGEAVQMALAFQASFSLRGSLAWLAKACRPAALSMIDSAVAALARRRARRYRRLLLRGAGRAEGSRPVPERSVMNSFTLTARQVDQQPRQ